MSRCAVSPLRPQRRADTTSSLLPRWEWLSMMSCCITPFLRCMPLIFADADASFIADTVSPPLRWCRFRYLPLPFYYWWCRRHAAIFCWCRLRCFSLFFFFAFLAFFHWFSSDDILFIFFAPPFSRHIDKMPLFVFILPLRYIGMPNVWCQMLPRCRFSPPLMPCRFSISRLCFSFIAFTLLLIFLCRHWWFCIRYFDAIRRLNMLLFCRCLICGGAMPLPPFHFHIAAIYADITLFGFRRCFADTIFAMATTLHCHFRWFSIYQMPLMFSLVDDAIAAFRRYAADWFFFFFFFFSMPSSCRHHFAVSAAAFADVCWCRCLMLLILLPCRHARHVSIMFYFIDAITLRAAMLPPLICFRHYFRFSCHFFHFDDFSPCWWWLIFFFDDALFFDVFDYAITIIFTITPCHIDAFFFYVCRFSPCLSPRFAIFIAIDYAVIFVISLAFMLCWFSLFFMPFSFFFSLMLRWFAYAFLSDRRYIFAAFAAASFIFCSPWFLHFHTLCRLRCHRRCSLMIAIIAARPCYDDIVIYHASCFTLLHTHSRFRSHSMMALSPPLDADFYDDTHAPYTAALCHAAWCFRRHGVFITMSFEFWCQLILYPPTLIFDIFAISMPLLLSLPQHDFRCISL